MFRSRSAHYLAGAFLAVAAGLAACSGPGEDAGGKAATAFEVPRPDLSGSEDAVRAQLEGRIEEVGALLDRGASTRDETEAQAQAVGGLGRLFHAYDLLPAADACYRRAADLAPSDAAWPYYLGVVHQIQGRWSEADASFEKTLYLAPEDLPASLRLATVRLEAGNPEAARALFERVLTLRPASAAAHEGLSRIALLAGEPEDAARHLEQALELQPGADVLRYPLATAYRSMGRGADAERHLESRGTTRVTFADPLVAALDAEVVGAGRRAARGGVALAEGRMEIALDEYRRAVQERPDDLQARLDLASLLAQVGEPEEAETHFRDAVRLDPESAAAHHGLGLVLARASKRQEARVHLERSLEIDPASEAARFHLGELEAAIGEHAAAAEAFSAVLDLNPQSVTAKLARARSYLALGRTEIAVREISGLAAEAPDDAGLSLRLGEALQRAGDAAGALAQYRKALEGDLAGPERAAAHLSAGNLSVKAGERERAKKHFEAALAEQPELVPARFNLAGLLALQGQAGEAIAHYRQVIELDVGNTAARAYLAGELLRLGQAGEAAAQYEEVLLLEPGNEGAVAGRAAALSLDGRHADALRTLEAAVAGAPESINLRHALARFLASCPEEALRDGGRAVEAALAVMAAAKTLDHAETVAMAMAEAGRFEEAVQWQREVLRQAASTAADRLPFQQANLERYLAGHACCASSP